MWILYGQAMQKHPNIKTVLQIMCVAAIAWGIVVFHQDTTSASTGYCIGGPMPRRVCGMIRREARYVPGAHKSWARSSDLAYVLGRESGFDFCAVNPGRHDCSYRGTSSSCGLFQRLPCDPLIFAHPRKQVRDGLRYIAGRYGSPAAAAAHSRSYGWY